MGDQLVVWRPRLQVTARLLQGVERVHEARPAHIEIGLQLRVGDGGRGDPLHRDLRFLRGGYSLVDGSHGQGRDRRGSRLGGQRHAELGDGDELAGGGGFVEGAACGAGFGGGDGERREEEEGGELCCGSGHCCGVL